MTATTAEISLWLRDRAGSLMQQARDRREASLCMRDATAIELKEAAALGGRMQHGARREIIKPMTVSDAKESSARDAHIAEKLEAEATKLLECASFLDALGPVDAKG